MRFSEYISVLKNPNFLKLWISQIGSQLTNYLLGFAVLIRVFRLTESSSAVSLILIAFGLATLLFGTLGGVYADRFDRKWLLTITNFLQTLAIALYLFVGDNIFLMAAVTFIYSSLNQFYLPVESPSIPNVVPAKQILVANSLFAFSGSLSLIIGFAAAGPVVAAFGHKAPFVVAIILEGLATVSTLLLPKLNPERKPTTTHLFEKFWYEFREGLVYFWKSKALHFPLLSMINIQVINGMLITLAPVFVERVLGLKLETGTAVVILPLAFGILVGSLSLGLEGQRFTKRTLILIGFFGMGLSLLGLSTLNFVENKLPFYFVTGFFAGMFNAHVFAPSHSLLQLHAVDHLRGRVYGALYMLLQVAATLPTFIAGILADRIPVLGVFAILGGYVLLVGMFLLSHKYSRTVESTRA
jgi:predicted MFS family arabinose efflux permease